VFLPERECMILLRITAHGWLWCLLFRLIATLACAKSLVASALPHFAFSLLLLIYQVPLASSASKQPTQVATPQFALVPKHNFFVNFLQERRRNCAPGGASEAFFPKTGSCTK